MPTKDIKPIISATADRIARRAQMDVHTTVGADYAPALTAETITTTIDRALEGDADTTFAAIGDLVPYFADDDTEKWTDIHDASPEMLTRALAYAGAQLAALERTVQETTQRVIALMRIIRANGDTPGNVIPLPSLEEGTPLPVMLGGGITRCGRCTRTFAAATYRCVEYLDGNRYRDICRYCADADLELHHWQEFCDIADAIDAVMRTAPGKTARDHLRAVLQGAADHFAAWRWDEDGNPLPPLDDN